MQTIAELGIKRIVLVKRVLLWRNWPIPACLVGGKGLAKGRGRGSSFILLFIHPPELH